ncbi:doublecortin domain-containing protein 2C isoform X2 [Rhinatrema bivittatum]|uniref:doublecortin domain-containing protein 2C isoform X2 n=1 Tax=Rhinatrema bivittatum TaxID=194408 RepID=UPI00112730BA|nr:doublecortin domain-containing protein 2C isoform X2 [Rhinatrema bivittatum]
MARLSTDETYYDRYPTQLIPARSVLFYRNGDPFFVGRKLVINGRHVPTFDALLSELTQHVKVPQGAVLRLYTPREGHPITALDQILPGETYVISSKEPFQKLDYLNIVLKKPQIKPKKVIKPVVHSRLRVPSKWETSLKPAFFINVLRNGDLLQSPLRIVLPKYGFKDWNSIRTVISEKTRLISGPVQRLYTLAGQLIQGPSELEHNQYYVAVGMEKFMHLPYNICILKNKQYTYSSRPDTLPSIQKNKYKKEKSMKLGNSSPVEEIPDKDLKRGKGYALLITGKRPSVFYAKSSALERVQHPIKVQHALLKTGPGVFRASKVRDEVHGASEVEESKKMKKKYISRRRRPRKQGLSASSRVHYSSCYTALSNLLAHRDLHH